MACLGSSIRGGGGGAGVWFWLAFFFFAFAFVLNILFVALMVAVKQVQQKC